MTPALLGILLMSKPAANDGKNHTIREPGVSVRLLQHDKLGEEKSGKKW
jgi:hypothetical protein